jgi:hypothetical protein
LCSAGALRDGELDGLDSTCHHHLLATCGTRSPVLYRGPIVLGHGLHNTLRPIAAELRHFNRSGLLGIYPAFKSQALDPLERKF